MPKSMQLRRQCWQKQQPEQQQQLVRQTTTLDASLCVLRADVCACRPGGGWMATALTF